MVDAAGPHPLNLYSDEVPADRSHLTLRWQRGQRPSAPGGYVGIVGEPFPPGDTELESNPCSTALWSWAEARLLHRPQRRPAPATLASLIPLP